MSRRAARAVILMYWDGWLLMSAQLMTELKVTGVLRTSRSS